MDQEKNTAEEVMSPKPPRPTIAKSGLPAAAHVQAALNGIQPKLSGSGMGRRFAPHVQAAMSAVQARLGPAARGGGSAAPHVQAAVARATAAPCVAQAKLQGAASGARVVHSPTPVIQMMESRRVRVFITVPWKKNVQVEIEDNVTGAQVWQVIRNLHVQQASKIKDSSFQLMIGTKSIADREDVNLSIDAESNIILKVKGGMQETLEARRDEEPFSTWTKDMKDALAANVIIIFNGPNGDRSKVYAQQEYDQVLEALDLQKKLVLTFIDPNFADAQSLRLLVHDVIAGEWIVDWDVRNSGKLITARSGDVVINYICVFLSTAEQGKLAKRGAKMFEPKDHAYQPKRLHRR
jgi:hypothetical protein